MALQQKAHAERPRTKRPSTSPPASRLSSRPQSPILGAGKNLAGIQRARTSVAMQQQVGNARTGVLLAQHQDKAEQAITKLPLKTSTGKPVESRFGTTSKPIAPSVTTTTAKEPKPAEAHVVDTPTVTQTLAAPDQKLKKPEEGRAAAAPTSTAAKSPESVKHGEPKQGQVEKKSGDRAGKKDTGEAKAEVGGSKAEEKKAPSPREVIAPTIHAVHQRSVHARRHSDAGPLVGNMKAAALEPETERTRSAAVNNVNHLNDVASHEPPKVDRASFKEALRKAIDAETKPPKTKSEADQVMKQGAKNASAQLKGEIKTQNEQVGGELKSALETPVGASTDQVPNETPGLKLEEVGKPPAPVSAGPVVPEPLSAERLDYSSDRAPTDKAMAENDVTKEQLAEGNENEMNQNLDSRSDAEKHEAAAQASYRQAEDKDRGHAFSAASSALGTQLGEIHTDRSLHIGGVAKEQTQTHDKHAAAHQRITNTINDIKIETQNSVKRELDFAELEAPIRFQTALTYAEEEYEKKFKEEKGGVWNWATNWGDDWKELIEHSLAAAREVYMSMVRAAINGISDFVERQLNKARKSVTDGFERIETFVGTLSKDDAEFGQQALESVKEDFAGMTKEIDDRAEALVTKLAQINKASFERMNAREEQLREENKSLWEKIYDATVGLIKKIIAFKDMLLGILAKVASVVWDIIKHPIRFLGNMVDAVGLGLKNFKENIATHLQRGLMQWIFGKLGGAGLKLPDKFDLEGILSIILQVLGLTLENFRARAVLILGEPVVAGIEKTAEIFMIIRREGVGGLWRFIKDKIEDLKSMVLDAIFDFIKERVIVAGITWVVGLLNPASAFFKACKAIYDIVMFFITHREEIVDLINAIIDSMAEISKGAIGTAAKWIENALAKAIPLAIGFLASLLGLGDISDTIKKIIEKAQAPVNKAIDWVINGAVKLVKAAGKLLGIGKKDDPKSKGLGHVGKEVHWKAGEETHTLWLELEGESPKVIMASGKGISLDQVLTSYSKEANKLEDKTKKETAQDNIATARGLLPAVQTAAKQEVALAKLSDSDAQRIKAKEKEVEKDEDELGVALRNIQVALGHSVKLPPTIVKHDEGRVRAEPLSKIPGNTTGSPPGSDNPPGWEMVTRVDRDDTDEAVQRWSTRYMKQVHLLSEKLHGPGVAWNLVPGQQKLNSELEKKPEKDAKTRTDVAKAATKEKEGATGEVLYYDVEVDFYGGELKGFPSSLTIHWGAMKEEEGGKWVRGDEKKEFLRSGIEAPAFGGGKIPISGLARETLRGYQFNDLLAQRIVDEVRENGPFNGAPDFCARMVARYDKETENVDFKKKYLPTVKALVKEHKLAYK